VISLFSSFGSVKKALDHSRYSEPYSVSTIRCRIRDKVRLPKYADYIGKPTDIVDCPRSDAELYRQIMNTWTANWWWMALDQWQAKLGPENRLSLDPGVQDSRRHGHPNYPGMEKLMERLL